MIEKRGALYTCKEHPELNVGKELAWEHLRQQHPEIAKLDVMRVPMPDTRPRAERRRDALAARRAAKRGGR